MKKVCSSCEYWYDFWGVCCNGSSEYVADYTNGDDTCPEWQEKEANNATD